MLKRLFVSFGLSGGIVMVAMLAQILSVPIFLTYWSAALYGEWLTLTGLAASLSIMNFGIQSYVCNLLISSYARREIEEGTRLLQSALYLYVLFTGFSMAVVIALGFSSDLLSWMKIEHVTTLHSRAILIIYGILATYSIPGGLLLSLFQVTKQMPRQLMYGLFERVIMLYTPMLVALGGGEPVIAAIAVAILASALIIIELQDVGRRSPFIIGLSYADRSLSLSFIKPGLTFFAVSLAVLMTTTGITLLLANHSGGQAVAMFSTTILLGNFVRTVVNQGMNVLWPEITEAGALRNVSDRLFRWYFLLLKLVTAFVFACAFGICAFGQDVLVIWTRGRIEIDPFLILLLSIYLVVQAPNLVSSAFGLALNHQADLLVVQAAAGLITLGFGVVFIHLYGVHGAAIALILGQVSIVLKSLKFSSSWIGEAWNGFLWKTFPHLVIGLIFSMIISALLIGLPSSFFHRLFGALAATAVLFVLFWQYWLIDAEKKLLLNMMLSLQQRKH